MIVDSSAIIAILFDEAEAVGLSRVLATSTSNSISVANWLEASIVMHRRTHGVMLPALDSVIKQLRIRKVSVTPTQADLARQAFIAYGKGNHPAALNFGDCFAYALSKANAQPLLFKGDDFRQTDVMVAEY